MSTQTTILNRNITNILPSKDGFRERLQKGPIKIHFGIDPTSPEIHIGHAVALWKLKEFQDQGHKVILLIGDFTAMIGDPTGRTAARQKLSKEETLENAKTYEQQASKILNFEGDNPVEVKFNSSWLKEINLADMIELSSNLTLQQMIERDFFQKRLKENKPIYLHEFLYPLMQGYDSVAMEVDAEIGGTDQTFNMLVGRTLLEKMKGKEKFVLTVPLLEGLDGRKMSKSYGNHIAITDSPEDMFGKIMSLQDGLISKYFELATKLPEEEIQSIKEDLDLDKLHPMDAKKRLGKEIISLYYNEHEAKQAQGHFEKVFQKREVPEKAVVYETANGEADLIEALTQSGLVKSKSEARRLLEQGGIEKDGEKVTTSSIELPKQGSVKLRVGKHRFLEVKNLLNS